MLTVGFPISTKENENRRALVPSDLDRIKDTSNIFLEENYGEKLGYSDEDYAKYGVKICDKETVLDQDCICDPKIGDAEYLSKLRKGQILFGYIHAVQNYDITEKIRSRGLTAIAWEDMYEDGRHTFWRNNEIAGEAAIMHAYSLYGSLPYDTKVALIGKGNTARGALKILTLLGADIHTYDRKTEKLLRKEIMKYNVIVNAIYWDTTRKDHIIYESDLLKMQKNSMIIDISCDKNGGIESSIPTTIENPIYSVNGVIHYVVDHTPALFYKTATNFFSEVLPEFLPDIMNNTYEENSCLKNALIIKDGEILDSKILKFQQR